MMNLMSHVLKFLDVRYSYELFIQKYIGNAKNK